MSDTTSTSPRLAWVANARLEAERLLKLARSEAMQEEIRRTQRELDDAQRHVREGACDLADTEIGIVGARLTMIAKTLDRYGPHAYPVN